MADYSTDTGALSYGSLIGLNTENASPPTNAYIGVDDQLQVFVSTSLAGAFVRLFARILLPDGTIVPNDWIYVPGNGRLGQNFYQSLAEGFLLSLTAYGSNATGPGQLYIRVSLIRGTIAQNGISQVLINGYTSGQNPLSWPASPLWPQSYGRGKFRTVVGTTPAAGADIVETVPLFAVWRLASFSGGLTTSAAVANRRAVLILDDGSTNFAEIWAGTDVVAGSSASFWWVDGAPVISISALNQTITGPREMYLQPGWRIRVTAVGMQAADQWAAPQYAVEEWLNA